MRECVAAASDGLMTICKVPGMGDRIHRVAIAAENPNTDYNGQDLACGIEQSKAAALGSK